MAALLIVIATVWSRVGALCALPNSSLRPRLIMWCSNVLLSTCLVSMSETFVRACHFDEFELPLSQLLLDPEVCSGEVAYFAKPPPPADPYCRCGISLNHEFPGHA